MAGQFTFDPEDMRGFVSKWMEEVGDQFRGRQYNGWAFFDKDRHLLEVCVTDSEKKWQDPATEAEAEAGGTLDILARWAKEAGADTLIGVHAHPAEDPPGPCPTLGQHAANAADVLDQQGLHLRGIVVLHGDELDGAVWIHKSGEPGAQRAIDQLRNAATVLPFLGNDADILPMAERLLPIWEERAARGEPDADRIVDVLHEIIASRKEGRKADKDLLLEGIAIVSRGLDNLTQPKRPEPTSVLDLPMFIPPSSGRLN